MTHPLEQLKEDEVSKSVAIFKKYHNEKPGDIMFTTINLLEPNKKFLRENSNLPQLPRIVQMSGFEFGSDLKGLQVEINLNEEKVGRFNYLPNNTQPPYNPTDFMSMEKIVISDTEFVEVIKRHGLTIQDVEERRLVIFPWPGSGYVHPSIPDGHRSLRVILFYKNRPLDNFS